MLRSGAFGLGAALLAACGSSNCLDCDSTPAATDDDAIERHRHKRSARSTLVVPTDVVATTEASGEPVLAGFDAFADTVKAFTSGDVWLVECNGIPAHQMMVGITNWQQQVPVAQNYTGTNAWQFPITPNSPRNRSRRAPGCSVAQSRLPSTGSRSSMRSTTAATTRSSSANSTTSAATAAEPTTTTTTPRHSTWKRPSAQGNPIAYALDGFAIYGSVEPDGSPLGELDEYNGHIGSDGVYHYHGTTTYPYINGGLVGVVQADDQVEPQPMTRAFRPAGDPLPGAIITGFEDLGERLVPTRIHHRRRSRLGRLHRHRHDRDLRIHQPGRRCHDGDLHPLTSG